MEASKGTKVHIQWSEGYQGADAHRAGSDRAFDFLSHFLARRLLPLNHKPARFRRARLVDRSGPRGIVPRAGGTKT